MPSEVVFYARGHINEPVGGDGSCESVVSGGISVKSSKKKHKRRSNSGRKVRKVFCLGHGLSFSLALARSRHQFQLERPIAFRLGGVSIAGLHVDLGSTHGAFASC